MAIEPRTGVLVLLLPESWK